MRYYGQRQIGPINLMRYEGAPNQFVVSLPQSYSNSTYTARADVLYICEGSGPLTVTECQTNNDLVGFTYQPGTAYVPEDVFGNNIVKLESGNNVPVLTVITLSRKQTNIAIDVNTATVNGSFTVPSNTYAAIVEGTLTVSNTTVDSNTGLFVIGKRDEERVIEGNGKLITFKIQN